MTSAAHSSTAAEAKARRRRRVDLANVGFAVAILAVVVFASVATDSFLTSRNIVSISRQLVTNGFLSLGMLVVVLTSIFLVPIPWTLRWFTRWAVSQLALVERA